MLQGKLRH